MAIPPANKAKPKEIYAPPTDALRPKALLLRYPKVTHSCFRTVGITLRKAGCIVENVQHAVIRKGDVLTTTIARENGTMSPERSEGGLVDSTLRRSSTRADPEVLSENAGFLV